MTISLVLILYTATTTTCMASGGVPEINAPSYVLVEQSTGKVLCEKNSHEVRPAASVMKTMVLLAAIEALDSGLISEKDMVNVSDAAAEVKGANVWLKSGESVSVGDLIKSVAMVSANDACMALAEFIGGSEGKFLAKINDRAKELGMNDTIFKDCIGSDDDGNVTSAYDVALMSRELMEHRSATPYISTWIDHIRNGQTQIVNTNKLLKTYQGAIGIKTGTTDKAGSCISACAERDKMVLIGVILGGANSKDRFNAISSLLDYGFSGYVMVSPKVPEDLVKKVRVLNGMISETKVMPQVEGEFLIPKGKENGVACEVNIEEELTAPLNMGMKVGTVKYKLGDEVLAEYDVVTMENVKEVGFYLVLMELFTYFVKL